MLVTLRVVVIVIFKLVAFGVKIGLVRIVPYLLFGNRLII